MCSEQGVAFLNISGKVDTFATHHILPPGEKQPHYADARRTFTQEEKKHIMQIGTVLNQ